MTTNIDEFDPWQLTSGLPDDFDFTINDSFFEFDPNYNDGQTLVLKLEGVGDGEVGEQTLMFPCGDGWETPDKGQTAQREDGKRKGFNKSSGYGLLIGAAVECGAGDALRVKGSPMQAGIWRNERFHMKRSEIDYGGEIGKKERLLPTTYLGAVGAGAAAAAPATQAAAQPAQAAPAGPRKAEPGEVATEGVSAPSTAGEGMSATVKVALIKLAKECESHDQFVERAYTEVDGVMGNPAAEEAVMAADGGLSIWAKARS